MRCVWQEGRDSTGGGDQPVARGALCTFRNGTDQFGSGGPWKAGRGGKWILSLYFYYHLRYQALGLRQGGGHTGEP